MTTAQGTNPTNDEGAEGEIVPEAFSEYREQEPETPGVHDESVTDDAELRPDYAAVIERIETLGPDGVSRRLEAAGKGLTELGVTINSEDGNRRYPIDIVPRIISAEMLGRAQRRRRAARPCARTLPARRLRPRRDHQGGPRRRRHAASLARLVQGRPAGAR